MPVCLVPPIVSQFDTWPAVSRTSLEDRVQRRLDQSPYLAVRRVNVEARQGVLILSGSVSNFFLKQMAQAAVAGIEGVQSIINRIDVVEPSY